MSYSFLCVDDEKMGLRSLECVCKQENPHNEVYSFDNPLAALKFFTENVSGCNPIDVALLDIDMPEMDGITLGSKLLKINPKLNVIIVSAYSDFALDAYKNNFSGYLLKPIILDALKDQLQVLRFKPQNDDEKLAIHCFGNFEVLFHKKPLKFSYIKTKELLAYLVDRNGAACTNAQLSVVLWEDNLHHEEYLKKLKQDLVATVSAVTRDEVFTQSRGVLAINRDSVKCDYFDYLDDKENSSKFMGEYMEDFSWAESTKAVLQQQINY